MMDKELKKKYDKSKMVLPIRLSQIEWSTLEKMKRVEGWENTAGFIKQKVFQGNAHGVYKRMKKSGQREDIQIVLASLFKSLDNDIAYMNYRFNFELNNIEKNLKGVSEAKAQRILSKMTQWKSRVMQRTELIMDDCEDILHAIQIKVEREKIDAVKLAPDSVIDKARKDWMDTMSPEALEAVRRDYVEFHKNHG